MAKVIQRSIKAGKGTPSKGKTVFRDGKTGEFVVLHTVNANSSSFTRDLSRAFRSNVDAALKKKK
ncbi:MAG TPA: hypothetical protein VHX18_13240 [Rhizomicrobium sp.]|jgi:hypothetical protein|nr:hypothetical protein [Rhizomicrobium sp.]